MQSPTPVKVGAKVIQMFQSMSISNIIILDSRGATFHKLSRFSLSLEALTEIPSQNIKQMQMRHLFNTWLSIMSSINKISVLYMTSQGTFLSHLMSYTPTAERFSTHFLKVAPKSRGKRWPGKNCFVWNIHFHSMSVPWGQSSHVRPQTPYRCIHCCYTTLWLVFPSFRL